MIARIALAAAAIAWSTSINAQEGRHQLLGSVVMLILTAKQCGIEGRPDLLASLTAAGRRLQTAIGFRDEMMQRLVGELTAGMQNLDCPLARVEFDAVARDALGRIDKLP